MLDGEICVWDNLKLCLAPFGLNKYVAGMETGKGEQHQGKDRYNLCYLVFDVLFVKAVGEEAQEIHLIGASLEDRKKVLGRVVK